MSTLAQSDSVSRHKDTKCVDRSTSIGKCLNCGKRLSFCGKPFTADLRCPNCGAVNVYRDSQQPLELKSGALLSR